MGHVAATRHLVSAPDITTAPSFDPVYDKAPEGILAPSCLCVPLVDDSTDKVVGVIKAVCKRSGGPFSRTDEALLDAFSCEIATVLTKTSRQAVYTKVLPPTPPPPSLPMAAP